MVSADGDPPEFQAVAWRWGRWREAMVAVRASTASTVAELRATARLVAALPEASDVSASRPERAMNESNTDRNAQGHGLGSGGGAGQGGKVFVQRIGQFGQPRHGVLRGTRQVFAQQGGASGDLGHLGPDLLQLSTRPGPAVLGQARRATAPPRPPGAP